MQLQYGAAAVGTCLITALLTAGCAKAKAAPAALGPPLDVPAPPARVLAPVDEPLLATAPPPEELPAAEPPRATARPPVRRPPTAGSEAEAKQDPAPATPPPAPAATAAPPPGETLRPAPAVAEAAEERRVRDLLTRTSRDLNRVDYRRLSADGREQYNSAKRFSEQAEEELKKRNFGFALTVADKAATIAAELAPR